MTSGSESSSDQPVDVLRHESAGTSAVPSPVESRLSSPLPAAAPRLLPRNDPAPLRLPQRQRRRRRPEILEAIVAASAGTAAPYGDDEYTRRMTARFASAVRAGGAGVPALLGHGLEPIALAALANPTAPSTATRRRTSTSTSAAHPSSSPAPSSWACRAATTSSSLRRSRRHSRSRARQPDPRPALRPQPHAAHRLRHALYASGGRGPLRGRAPPRPESAHGRRALRQRRGGTRLLARGPHLARRRGRALARRHQERRDQRRGDRGVRCGARP